MRRIAEPVILALLIGVLATILLNILFYMVQTYGHWKFAWPHIQGFEEMGQEALIPWLIGGFLGSGAVALAITLGQGRRIQWFSAPGASRSRPAPNRDRVAGAGPDAG